MNGNGKPRVILYARVSSKEQAKHGYSIRQQIDALRQHAEDSGYTVVAEVRDEGHSGATLDRPGLNQVRDLVAEGGVDVVLAQDLDRISREPWHYEYLKANFADYGTTLVALDDGDDDSPMGEFVSYIRRGVAKLERQDISRRTQRGRRQRVREGKIIGGGSPPYGYRYNADKTNYEIDWPAMIIIRRIFKMSAEGASLNKIKKTLESDGIRPPKGGRYWHRAVIRDVILNDMNRPHTYAELERLVIDGRMDVYVLSTLDPDKHYGVWFYNQRAVKRTNGGDVKRRSKPKPQSEWMAVPTPDTGIPAEWVDAARENIRGNVRFSTAGKRFWALSGLAFCPCGTRLGTHTKHSRGRVFGYYVCRRRQQHGPDACEHARFHNADKQENKVFWFVAEHIIFNPGKLRELIRAHAESQRTALHDYERETRGWLEQLTRIEDMRERYLEQHAAGLRSLEDAQAKVADLDRQREGVERELAALRDRETYLAELDALEDDLMAAVAELRLNKDDDELLRDTYRKIGLKVVIPKDGEPEISWDFGGCKVKAIR